MNRQPALPVDGARPNAPVRGSCCGCVLVLLLLGGMSNLMSCRQAAVLLSLVLMPCVTLLLLLHGF